MNPSHPQQEPSLIDVQLAFEHWRLDRASPRSGTPEHLRTLAVGLLKNHRPSVVYKTLGLNSSTLKQWATIECKASTTTFVSLPDNPPQPGFTNPLAVEPAILISLPNGVQVSVREGAALDHVLAVASLLGAAA